MIVFCEGVDHVFDDGLGLLHMACISQNVPAVQCLVAARVDTNYRDSHGQFSMLFGSSDCIVLIDCLMCFCTICLQSVVVCVHSSCLAVN